MQRRRSWRSFAEALLIYLLGMAILTDSFTMAPPRPEIRRTSTSSATVLHQSSSVLDDNTDEQATYASHQLLVRTLKAVLFDTWYRGQTMDRVYARFYALETIARVPYFAYTSVLHFWETTGQWRQADRLALHFAENWNELHHLLIMEELLVKQLKEKNEKKRQQEHRSNPFLMLQQQVASWMGHEDNSRENGELKQETLQQVQSISDSSPPSIPSLLQHHLPKVFALGVPTRTIENFNDVSVTTGAKDPLLQQQDQIPFLDRFVAQHVAFVYFWMASALYLWHPATAYSLNQAIEQEAYDTYDKFLEQHKEYLKKQPAPAVAVNYYSGSGQDMFDRMSYSSNDPWMEIPPQTPPSRRVNCETLYDCFVAIRDDELEHSQTMERLKRESLHQ